MDILVPYQTRRGILSSLSAFDIAKLDHVLRGILDENERSFYLNPARDIIWDTSEMESLARKGMKLIVCGHDVHCLHQRLHNTNDYLQVYGSSKRLQIYLLGVFPMHTHAHNRMLHFGVSQPVHKDRVMKDQKELERIRQITYGSPSDTHGFIMSFGASTKLSHSTWHLVTDSPDKTTDVWIYIPSYHDRCVGKIHSPRSVVPGLFGFSRRSRVFRLLAFYIRLVTLAVEHDHITQRELQGQGEILRFCFTNSLSCDMHY